MLLPVAVTFLVAAGLAPLVASWARRRNLLDIPNHRSSHVLAMPRIGGVAIVLAVLAGVGAFVLLAGTLGGPAVRVITAACALALLGLVDDVQPLAPALRLFVQIIVSIVLVLGVGAPMFDGPRQWGWIALAVFWLVALTNAYNFMDGIDGIAAGQAIVAGFGWAVVGVLTSSSDTAVMGSLAAAAAGGFLIHNWAPARIFMGDGGSAFFGFLFAAIPMIGLDLVPRQVLAAPLLMWPFVFDAGFTLLRRLRQGENILRAHRSHLYQRLTATGLSHRQVSSMYSALAALGAVAAVALVVGPGAAGAVAVLAIVIAAFGLWLYVRWREAVAAASP